MENNSQENALFDRMPLAAMHIRTALGNIYYAAQRLAPPEARDNDPELDKTAAVLYQGYYRLLRLAKDLESLELLQRQQPLPVENTDLKVWLDEIVQEATVPFQLKGVTLKMLCPERYVVTAVDTHWLGQAVWHLLNNALCACADGGHVTVKLTVQKPNVLLEITDDGCGIPAARQELLFDWLMRPKEPEFLTGGLGVGLPLSYRVAQLHGGQLLLDSREGEGTTATLVLPLRRADSQISDNVFQYTGGFQRSLLELSTALPDTAFLTRHLDE